MIFEFAVDKSIGAEELLKAFCAKAQMLQRRVQPMGSVVVMIAGKRRLLMGSLKTGCAVASQLAHNDNEPLKKEFKHSRQGAGVPHRRRAKL
jgi:hypothetical protein